MSVLLQTNKGDLVIDLFFEKCPKACLNFISLCKIKYYDNCLFFNVQKGFIAQTGDPTNTGQGGASIWELLDKSKKRIFFESEVFETLRHNKKGLLSMASFANQKNTNASQFYLTLTERHLDYLDDTNTIFGQVVEGLDTTLKRINHTFTNDKGVPLHSVRILKAIVLVDPFEEDKSVQEEFYPKLAKLMPNASPVPIEDGYDSTDEGGAQQQMQNATNDVSKSQAVVLEILGDLPDADAAPPDNVLFVCKLNPFTSDDDLGIVFSRFGKVKKSQIIRDKKTGKSMCYSFIEYENRESCEQAYLKMENAMIDDRRIHVDFSQSVSKLWNNYNKFGKAQDTNVHKNVSYEGQESSSDKQKSTIELKKPHKSYQQEDNSKHHNSSSKHSHSHHRSSKYDDDEERYRKKRKHERSSSSEEDDRRKRHKRYK